MLRYLTLIFVVFFANQSLAKSTVDSKKADYTIKVFSLEIKFSDSCQKYSNEYGALVSCQYSFLFPPEGGEIYEQHFDGNEYGDVKINFNDDKIEIVFTSRGDTAENFYKDLVDYYAENPASYIMKYRGPNFNTKGFGKAIPY